MEPIAIIGMSFRFPGGAETSDEFWQMLVEKRCAATDYPKDRFDIDAFWHPDGKKQNVIAARQGHFLSSDVKNFDGGFFSMAPHEIGAMDPQQRGIMETTYHAIENAGLRMDQLAGTKTSVYVGCFTSDFATMQHRDTQSIPKYNSLGTAGSMLANRISWFYDLHGESLYVDTACSSSLVAMTLACQSLALGESTQAVVGGSSLILVPEFSISLSNMNFLSPTGRCQSFDAGGDGYGRGEGFATLILKPVSKAIADGDPIRALIRSIGSNQDGHTSSGITQPSREMQTKLIRETYRKAALDMKHTRFFEAHGTGTAVGDPTEARAIGEAFFKYRSKDDPIYVGAVKSNIGHLEGTSGLAGVVKSILALEKGVIPPNTNFKSLNPRIDADFFNLRFPTECIPWPAPEGIRRASVNSFGFGGTNAHVVLESADGYLTKAIGGHQTRLLARSLLTGRDTNGRVYTNGIDKPLLNGTSSSLEPRLLILSASDEDGVTRQAQDLATLMSKDLPDLSCGKSGEDVLQDIAFTLNERRTHFSWKSYALLSSLSDFANLTESLPKVTKTPSSPARIGFVFTGQGAQWPRMGLELLRWPLFERSLAQSQEMLTAMGCQWKLVDELEASAECTRINDPEFSQAITTAVQIALVDLLEFLGVKPAVVVGHSSGEIAAAYCAGFLSHESAMRVSYFRGMLASELSRSPGERWGMASVGIPSSQLPQELEEVRKMGSDSFDPSRLAVSCNNSPSNITVSGPIREIGVLVDYLIDSGTFARRLKVDVGYHSQQMQNIAPRYLEHLGNLQPRKRLTGVKMVSSVTMGDVGVDEVCSGSYWVQNMVSPVRFTEAIDICCVNTNETTKFLDRSHSDETSADAWLEIGPHTALRGPLREIVKSHEGSTLQYSSLLQRSKLADHTFLTAMGELCCRGVSLDLSRVARASTKSTREPRTVVDLPKYPFNHSSIYWEESNRSKTFRARTRANHPLLGSPVIDWNPLDAKWRFIIRKDEIPWVTDHRIHGSIWYPAGGMVVMAIEALKQIQSEDGDLADFELTNVSFTAPIVVDEGSSGNEVQLSLVPAAKSLGKKHVGYKFRILAKRNDGSWSEVCDGTIASHKPTKATLDINGQHEEENLWRAAVNAYEETVARSQISIGAADMYRKIDETSGLQYGPAFQCLSDVHSDKDGNSHAKLVALDAAVAENSKPFTIHPATLDNVFQAAIPALSKAMTESMTTLVPSRLTRLWVSRKGAGAGTEVVHAKANFTSRRSAAAWASVFSQPDMRMTVKVEELEMTEVAREQGTEESDQAVVAKCHELEWKVDPSILTLPEMQQYCMQHRGTGPEPEEWYTGVRLMILGFAQQAFKTMKQADEKPIQPLERYAAWLRAGLDRHWASGSPEPLPSGLELQELASHFESTGHRGSVGALVGRNLRDILVGDMDPLATFLADDEQFLANIYEEFNRTGKAFPMLGSYLDVIVHKNPGLKFLEVGAGTGTTTNTILDVIASIERGPRCAEYTFTDISTFFFQGAQERFKDYDCLTYRALNIEEDVEAQDFVPGTYDMVVAAQVLHTTSNLGSSLANIRKLLKPGGKLILVESTSPEKMETGFVWGTLLGWWLGSEDYRHLSAVVDEARWDMLLRESSFSGTDHVFRDWDNDDCHGWSIMISTATSKEVNGTISNSETSATAASPSPTLSNITLVVDSTSNIQLQVSENLQKMLEAQEGSGPVKLLILEELSSNTAHCQGGHCIFLADLDTSHLHDADSNVFELYRSVLTGFDHILWVQTHDDRANDPPYWGMATGLRRVLCSENPFTRVVLLALQRNSTDLSTHRAAEQIIKTMTASQALGQSDDVEEYMEFNGRICVNRLRQATYLDKHIFTRTQNQVRLRKFDSPMPIAMEIRTPGLLDTIEWVEDKEAYRALEPDEVEVKVRAIGVNFKDALTLLGRVNESYVGSDCSGYVTRIGSNVTSCAVGDRVMVGCLGTYKSLVRVPKTLAVKIPDSISLEEAAGLPTAFCTAYLCLFHVARLQKGESILIHAAAGGTGQAALQMAKVIGAEIFATVGSQGKRDLLVERYGIPEDHIFYSRDKSFADGIKRYTKGRGVDVVLNSLSGELLEASWDLIAEFGRFIEIGRKDIDTRGYLSMFPFRRNATFAGVDLVSLVKETSKVGTANLMLEVMKLMASGAIRPSFPTQTFSIDQAEQAFRLLVSGKSTGKIILTMNDDAMVMVREPEDSEYRFSPDATYVIAGGLGGLGRQIIQWMARRGAVNILVLSRSGASGHPAKMRMIEKMKERGINLHCTACDISDLASIQAATQEASRTLPPIKGCFQAAMVIQDRTFASMTYQDWNESVRPKVQGSWNLHTVLPPALDFFIMLSSSTGIFGNAGQANYSAGNSFQDELARYRVARGQKAVAIDVGMVLDEGWVAEHADTHQAVMRFDHVLPVSQADLFAMFDYYCNPDTVISTQEASQIVTGLQVPSIIIAEGRHVPDSLKRPLFLPMHQISSGGDASQGDSTARAIDFAAMFESFTSLAEAAEAIAEALKLKLCKILGLEDKDRTTSDRMDSFGVDSLIALEVRNWLAREVRADMAVYEILGDAKLIDTGMTAAKKSAFRKARWQ